MKLVEYQQDVLSLMVENNWEYVKKIINLIMDNKENQGDEL